MPKSWPPQYVPDFAIRCLQVIWTAKYRLLKKEQAVFRRSNHLKKWYWWQIIGCEGNRLQNIPQVLKNSIACLEQGANRWKSQFVLLKNEFLEWDHFALIWKVLQLTLCQCDILYQCDKVYRSTIKRLLNLVHWLRQEDFWFWGKQAKMFCQ